MLPCGGETEWAKPVTLSHLGWVHDTDTWRLNKSWRNLNLMCRVYDGCKGGIPFARTSITKSILFF